MERNKYENESTTYYKAKQVINDVTPVDISTGIGESVSGRFVLKHNVTLEEDGLYLPIYLEREIFYYFIPNEILKQIVDKFK